MQTSTPDPLDLRITQLEGLVRIMGIGIGVLLVLVIGAFIAATRPHPIAQAPAPTNQMTLTDSATGATLILSPASIAFRNRNGTALLYLGLTRESPTQTTLQLADSSGAKRLEIFVGDQPNVNLYDTVGKKRAALYIGTTTLVPELDMIGADDRERLVLNGSDGPFARWSDGKGAPRAYLGIFTDGSSGAYVKDASGNVTWSAP